MARQYSPVYYYLYGLLRGIVAHPDDIDLIEIRGEGSMRDTIVLELRLHSDDVGKFMDTDDTVTAIRKLLDDFLKIAGLEGMVIFRIIDSRAA